MLECKFGAVSGNGAEGQGGRGVAGGEPDGFALVGFLFLLDRGRTFSSGENLKPRDCSKTAVERLLLGLAFVRLAYAMEMRKAGSHSYNSSTHSYYEASQVEMLFTSAGRTKDSGRRAHEGKNTGRGKKQVPSDEGKRCDDENSSGDDDEDEEHDPRYEEYDDHNNCVRRLCRQLWPSKSNVFKVDCLRGGGFHDITAITVSQGDPPVRLILREKRNSIQQLDRPRT